MFKFGNYLNIWKCIRTCITLKLLEVTCEVPQDSVLSHTVPNLSYNVERKLKLGSVCPS